jgi:hypothetical protein
VVLHDLDAALDVPRRTAGREAALGVMGGYREALADFRVEVHEYIERSPYVVCRVTYSGSGPASGAPTTVASVDRHLVRGERIVEITLGYQSVGEALA